MSEQKESVFIEKKPLRERLRKIWREHHEAIITGIVGFSTNALTGYIAIKYINGQKINRVNILPCREVGAQNYPESFWAYPEDVEIIRQNGTKMYRHISPVPDSLPWNAAVALPAPEPVAVPNPPALEAVS